MYYSDEEDFHRAFRKHLSYEERQPLRGFGYSQTNEMVLYFCFGEDQSCPCESNIKRTLEFISDWKHNDYTRNLRNKILAYIL